MRRVRLVILGSTGSIGRQALQVVERLPDRIEVIALAANRNAEVLLGQAAASGAGTIALADPDASPAPAELPAGVTCLSGPQALVELAVHPDADVVLNALVGAAGLRASHAALSAGKRLALANKESLVVGGDLLMPMVSRDALGGPSLLPVDSEHSAIFQCLMGESPSDVARIWLTASGGPFRGRTRDQLADVTVSDALAHPRWEMGPKITVDSATLMNKGLEAIEAHHLFGAAYDDIRIVVHPQSCVHSMVEFADGSVKAQLGATDMRVPIQFAISYPERWPAPSPPVDFTALGRLDFEDPDPDTFRCLALALEAGRAGGTAPAALNAANEIAVAAFLEGRVRLTDIDSVVGSVLESHANVAVESLEQLEAVDSEARAAARAALPL